MDYQEVKLKCGMTVHIDFDAHYTTCVRCKKKIKFGLTVLGRTIPVIKHGEHWQRHITDCEYAQSQQQQIHKREGYIEDEDKTQKLLSEM